MERLYIRNVFGGRSIYDSARDSDPYELIHEAPSLWIFNLHTTNEELIQNLLDNRDFLNLFVQKEEAPGSPPTHKSWFSSSQGKVVADPAAGLIQIYADTRHDYAV